jgi:hypothetical protein
MTTIIGTITAGATSFDTLFSENATRAIFEFSYSIFNQSNNLEAAKICYNNKNIINPLSLCTTAFYRLPKSSFTRITTSTITKRISL